MNSPGFQIRYHTAFTDFETAVELAKTESKINNNSDIVGYYANQFDIPYQVTRVSEVFKYALDNLFILNLPVEFQIKNYHKKYTLPEALNLAAVYNNKEFLNSFQIDHSDNINSLLYICGHTTKEVDTRYSDFVFLDNEGLLDKVVSDLGLDWHYYMYFLAKNWMWDRLVVFLNSGANHIPKTTKQSICNGMLASRRKGILQNPPIEELKMVGMTSDEYMQHIKLQEGITSFPYNLCTKRQVEFFADDIRRIGYESINGYIWFNLTTLSTVKALSKIFDKKFVVPKAARSKCDFRIETPIKDQIRIVKYISGDPKDYLISRITRLSNSYDYRLLYYVKEYLARGYSKDKISKQLDNYYKNFPNDKFKIE